MSIKLIIYKYIPITKVTNKIKNTQVSSEGECESEGSQSATYQVQRQP